jgi:hypothetical protein
MFYEVLLLYFSHMYSKYYNQRVLEIKILQGVLSTSFRKFLIISYADVADTYSLKTILCEVGY